MPRNPHARHPIMRKGGPHQDRRERRERDDILEGLDSWSDPEDDICTRCGVLVPECWDKCQCPWCGGRICDSGRGK